MVDPISQTGGRPESVSPPEDRPFVLVNIAITADGKLAPAHRRFIPFGSPRDQKHVFELRATADAVMSGARTLDLSPIAMDPGGAKYCRLRLRRGLPACHLRIIASGNASINPQAAVFQNQCSQTLVLAGGGAPPDKIQALQKVADEVQVFGTEDLDFTAALRWLRHKANIQRLLCEGGGELNAALFAAGLVDELHVTICPLILGGRHAPTLVDGAGVPDLADATRLKLTSLKRAQGDLFLVYRVLHNSDEKPPLPGRLRG
jgi:riboflavin-specific deaminase-like protein